MSRKSIDSSRSSSLWYLCSSTYRSARTTTNTSALRNRALSIRSNNRSSGGGSSTNFSSHHHGSRRGFSLSSLRGTIQPELSKKLYRLIKSENNLISAHETAAKERLSIAQQLSEWGEQTSDEGISDISDKVGVILSELGEQEDNYAHALDESRGTLKTIRNTEKSVQPSRDGKNKIADEIAKLKSKEPESTRLVVLEQELVRAEAENLVAEAQLTNIVCPFIIPYRMMYFSLPSFFSFNTSSQRGSFLVLYNPIFKWLTKNHRPVKNSKKPTQLNSSPPSSAPRSKSSSLGTVCVCSTCSTIPPSFPVTRRSRIRKVTKPDKSSIMPKTICATGDLRRRRRLWTRTPSMLLATRPLLRRRSSSTPSSLRLLSRGTLLLSLISNCSKCRSSTSSS